MSTLNNTLTINIPEYISPSNTTEVFNGIITDCLYCNGTGFFSKENSCDSIETNLCPICQGVGQIQAILTIEWKPLK